MRHVRLCGPISILICGELTEDSWTCLAFENVVNLKD